MNRVRQLTPRRLIAKIYTLGRNRSANGYSGQLNGLMQVQALS